jgi:transposase
VHTTEADFRDGRARRRKHTDEFKAAVIAECTRPGVSMAAVALHHRLNANLLRRWVAAAEASPRRNATRVPALERSAASTRGAASTSAFVPVSLESVVTAEAGVDIELRRGAVVVKVRWPMSAAAECGVWLRELLA